MLGDAHNFSLLLFETLKREIHDLAKLENATVFYRTLSCGNLRNLMLEELYHYSYLSITGIKCNLKAEKEIAVQRKFWLHRLMAIWPELSISNLKVRVITALHNVWDKPSLLQIPDLSKYLHLKTLHKYYLVCLF